MHATPTYAQQEQRRTAPARRPRRVPSRKPENHGRRPEPESNRHQLRSYSASAALVARVEVARRGRSSYDTGLFHLLITSLSKRHLTARLSAILSRSGETPPSWQRLAPERLQSPGWVSMAFIRPSRCHSRPPSPATSLNIAWVVRVAKIARSLKATNWPVSSQNCKNVRKSCSTQAREIETPTPPPEAEAPPPNSVGGGKSFLVSRGRPHLDS